MLTKKTIRGLAASTLIRAHPIAHLVDCVSTQTKTLPLWFNPFVGLENFAGTYATGIVHS